MAYPTIDAPYGLVPVKLLSGVPFVGTTRQYSIASGYGTNIFYGDAVKLVTGGTVERDTFDAAMTPIGVFMGCTFTDPNSEQVTFKQYFLLVPQLLILRLMLLTELTSFLRLQLCLQVQLLAILLLLILVLM